MQTMAKENKALDIFKFLACILVVGSHIPQVFPSEIVTVYFKQWFMRFSVPFFFLSSGYFFSRSGNKLRTLKKILGLFLLGYVLYLPDILASQGDSGLVSTLVWNAVFGYEHLWYISATLEGMLVWYLAEKIPGICWLFEKLGLAAAALLLLLGALTDEYYHLLSIGPLTALGDFLLNFGGPRNAVFFGYPMLMLGGALHRYEDRLRKIPTPWLTAGLAVTWMLSLGECRLLVTRLGMGISCDITLLNFWPAIFLFLLSSRIPVGFSDAFGKQLRKAAEYVYILHWLVIALLGRYVPMNGLAQWAVTMVLCTGIWYLTDKLLNIRKKETV